jgi:hypothetical protein
MRIRHSLLGAVTVLLLAASLGACRGFSAEAPAGFASYSDWSHFRSVSPEGIVYRVRSEKNEPEAGLAFWREALKKRMLDAGYVFVSEGDVKAANEPGYLLELAAPLGEQDYTYLVALFARGSRLVIVEASGEVTRFAPHRPAIVEAIGKTRF